MKMRSKKGWCWLWGIWMLACCSCRGIPCWQTGEDDLVLLCPTKAKTCALPTMMALAQDLDHLENHIERHGSVVIAKPTVWGQSRLTMYREEFEDIMRADKDHFQETLQGRMATEDQAYLLNAVALSAAVSGPGSVIAYPTGQVNAAGEQIRTYEKITAPAAPPASELPTAPSFSTGGPRIAPAEIYKESLLTKTGSKSLSISLEPTIVLEQKARYLNYLNQLRRDNEGDDTADSPGYSLNLIRIPVSVLPGKCTDKGYGAEVTMTLSPVLGDELLPTTFRNLVVNDLVDQISFALVDVLNYKPAMEKLEEYYQAEKAEKAAIGKGTGPLPIRGKPDEAVRADVMMNRKKEVRAMVVPRIKSGKGANLGAGSSPKLRNARLPLASSQIEEVLKEDAVVPFVEDAYSRFREDYLYNKLVHLPDIQNFVREELQAAYKLLTSPGGLELWAHCRPELAVAIKTRNKAQISSFEEAVRTQVQILRGGDLDQANDMVSTLVWGILIESALLTDHLIQDMREAASARGIACAAVEGFDFFHPFPSPEARAAFNDYVRLRWPIHVFALDPITQDQNLGDSFTRRREMQLALSMAFTSGNIGARTMTRYGRRIDQAYDTIALNRTAVGFSHGEDTFGWRFYPRFQTPDIESNLTVLTRDLIIGGPSKEHDLAQRKLEPGMRECVAIVLMPAFVPYLTCDATTNYFKLTNPKSKVMDSTHAMKLSRSVKAIQSCAPGVLDMDCYRDGDFMRLLRKVEQLSARLPLQTHQLSVPYENTLGGFQMFNTGVSDLAPELLGWYGVTRIDPAQETNLFLVGNHFNLKQTRIIAGGKEVSSHKLLSRQVIHVKIPANPLTSRDDSGQEVVPIRLATPYGVTQSLLVPVQPKAGAASAAAAGYSLDPKNTEVKITYAYQKAPPQDLALASVGGSKVGLLWTEPTGIAGKSSLVEVSFDSPSGLNLAKVDFEEGIIFNKGKASFTPVMLEKLGAHLIEQLKQDLKIRTGTIPPPGLVTARVKIHPQSFPPAMDKTVPLDTQLVSVAGTLEIHLSLAAPEK